VSWAKQNATFNQYHSIFAAFSQYECKNATHSIVRQHMNQEGRIDDNILPIMVA
jgi:hypothetical protein